MNRHFAAFVGAAMTLGVLAGWLSHATLAPQQILAMTAGLGVVTDLFLRLVKMVIAPLVLATLIGGIAHMENAAQIGRVGLRTMAWFLAASLVSLSIGLAMVHLIQPGAGLALPVAAVAPVASASFTLADFVTHLVPTSIVDAMARNEILQIVVFAILVGLAAASVEGRAPQIVALAEQVTAIMLKVTGFVMTLAPLAIFAALTSTVATQGPGVLATYAKFVGGFYLSLTLLWALLWGAGFLVIGRRVSDLFGAIRTPALLAFSTASSEAAYPQTLARLEAFGVGRRIVSFVLPLGYSFNLDGSMMYCTFATLFIAQAYGVQMSWGQQATMLLLLMVTSKGMAGVPRASLVVVSTTLTYFGLPAEGLLLILAVDHLLDMGRSASNVVGNSVAAAVVGRWEGQLAPATSEDRGP